MMDMRMESFAFTAAGENLSPPAGHEQPPLAAWMRTCAGNGFAGLGVNYPALQSFLRNMCEKL